MIDLTNHKEKVGENFHQGTKYTRGSLGRGGLDWNSKPKVYKSYPNSPHFQLIPPKFLKSEKTLQTVLTKRRSVRSFSKQAITIENLSYLLWGSTGISKDLGNFQFRTSPSAGALYPIETYVIINQEVIVSDKNKEKMSELGIASLSSGIYHYNIRSHCVEQLAKGDFRVNIAKGALDQQMAAIAPLVFIWTANFKRSVWKYKQRGYRYIFLDAGHVAAQLSLCATDNNLGSCQIAAIYDDEINQLLNLDGKTESAIYLSVVGHI